MTECKGLINRFGAGVLKITKLFEVFLKLYAAEDKLQVIVQKSDLLEIMKENGIRNEKFDFKKLARK